MAGAERNKIREYLLGRLTDPEEEQVELRLLSDPHFGEEFDTIVDEIVDEYVEEKLDGEEFKEATTAFFKSPVRQEKLRFALALHDYLTKPLSDDRQPLPFPGKRHTWVFRAAAAIAAVAVLAGGFWLFSRRSSPQQTFATLILSISNSERAEGSEAAVIRLPLNATALKISLQLPSSLRSAVRYRVELKNDEGEKKTLDPAAHNEQSVTIVIPEAEVKRGQYVLSLFAVRADSVEQRLPGNYLFTVE